MFVESCSETCGELGGDKSSGELGGELHLSCRLVEVAML
jgi:hypothetical protein